MHRHTHFKVVILAGVALLAGAALSACGGDTGENPYEATDESLARGAEIFTANCAGCHGENGEGDGPAATGMEPAPTNLHEDHVQINSDDALFQIISDGVKGTAMPGWEAQLSEEERWHVVNFMRTFE